MAANNFTNLVGMKFKMLTVISRNAEKGREKVYWNCLCDCGDMTIVDTSHLRGKTKSCGCLLRQANRADLTGKQFNMLTVVSFHSKTDTGKIAWNCVCNCGNTTVVRAHNLASGAVKSCGCLSKMAHFIKHGLTNHRMFNIWDNMKARCYRTTCKAYHNYGGRGIKIHDDWRTNFQCFFDWSMSHGYKDTYSIERVDYNGNYEPSNCKWIPMEDQWKNKRGILGQQTADEIRVKLKQGSTVPELAKFHNVSKDCVRKIKTGKSYFDIKMD